MNHFGLEGLDPVAFLGHFQRVQGKARYKSRFRGKTYFFSSRRNQEIFEIRPERFLPQIDGFCPVVYGLSQRKVPGLVDQARIFGNHYYLFSQGAFATLASLFPAVTRLAQRRYHQINARVTGQYVPPAPVTTEGAMPSIGIESVLKLSR